MCLAVRIHLYVDRIAYLRRVVEEAVLPYQVEVRSEFGFRLVLVTFDVLHHGLQVHRMFDN